MHFDTFRSLLETKRKANPTYLVGSSANELLRALNIPTEPCIKVSTLEEAETAAKKIGYPVVLKVDSPNVLHKSELGGVRTGINVKEELEAAFHEMSSALLKFGVSENSLVVQKELHGIEVILGGKRDPTFGPIVMFGLGGVWIELLNDVSIALAPVSDARAKEMIREIKGFPLLDGFRNFPKLDTETLATALQTIAAMFAQLPEISEFEINPYIIAQDSKNSAAVDSRISFSQNQVKDEKSNTSLSGKAFGSLFHSSSIVVVGGSLDYSKVGGRIVQRIVNHGYQGKVIVVNPREKSTDTIKVYSSITEVPDPIDAALMVVPSETSVQVMRECAKKAVKFAAVYSTGFSETDVLGADRESRLLHAAEGKVRIAGPNILGFIHPRAKLFAEFTSFEGSIPEGNVGFLAQSGGMGSSLVTVAADKGIGTSALISTGNEIDLDLADGIDYFIQDPCTKVIVCYCENVSDGAKLKLAAQAALEAGKPLVIHKSGRSMLGKSMAKSHTAAVAVEDRIFDAFAREYGVIRVGELYESLEIAKAFSMQPLPKRNRVAIVSSSGGANVLLTDILAASNVQVPEFSKTTQDRLRTLFVDTPVRNPVDVSASVVSKPEYFGVTMDTILREEEVDLVIVVVTTFSERQGRIIAEGISDKRKYGKPILVVWPFPDSAIGNLVKYLQDNSVPVYLSAESAGKAAVAIINYSSFLSQKAGSSSETKAVVD